MANDKPRFIPEQTLTAAALNSMADELCEMIPGGGQGALVESITAQELEELLNE